MAGIYEASGKFYVQYRVAVNGKRVQRSHFLCGKDDRYRAKTDRSVKLLTRRVHARINSQQAEQSPDGTCA